LFDGVDRVRRAGAVEFETRRFEPFDAVDRGAHHFEANVGGRNNVVFLPRLRGDNEQHAIEVQLGPSRTRGCKMSDMHGIERAAEDS
jgi:hypothetical protein